MAIIKINELPSGSGNLTPDDLIVFMDDPSGSKNTRKLTIQELASVVGGTTLENQVVAGSGISVSYDDTANTLTVSSSGVTIIDGGGI